MKKKILSGVFALALLATADYGGQKSLKSNANLSDLALANVEALAETYLGIYDCSNWCQSEDDWICRIYADGVLVNTYYNMRKKADETVITPDKP